MPRDVRSKSIGSHDSETSPLSPPPPIPSDSKPLQPLSLPPLSLPPKDQRTPPKPKSDNFLTLTAKKKNIIIDGMRSLKKSRKPKTDNTLSIAPVNASPSLADVSMSLQNLSFTSELYNVPTNNSAVQSSAEVSSPHNDSTSSAEYFTESDRLASDELIKEEDVYFVDAPVTTTLNPPVTPSNYLPTHIVARFPDEASANVNTSKYIIYYF